MKAKIAILTDLHFSRSPNRFIPERKGEFADILLLRAVHRLNRYIKPDLVFVGGDLLDSPHDEELSSLLSELKKIIDLLDAPAIVINGNHDPEREIFEKIMGKQPDFLDINGIRFVPFFDPEMPGYNAFRTNDELARMRRLGKEFDGPLVSLQHVPLFPPACNVCGYNYTNADEILDIMCKTHYIAALSGHYHHGFELLAHEGCSYITGRALCEKPFGYAIIALDGKGLNCKQENLAMPEELHLIDHHVHTKMAYCNENMDIARSSALGKLFGLDRIVISEHSAHLYFNREDYGQRMHYYEGLGLLKRNERVDEYFELYTREADDFCRLGMEVDYDSRGQGVIEPDIWDKLQFRNGSIHEVNTKADIETVEKEFLRLTEAAAAAGVDVLVHPFRVFKRRGLELPKHLFVPVVEILQRYRTAAEINFHANEPPAEFFHMCIENDIKLSFGSDSHNLYEVGEFYPHLNFLRKIAPGANITDLLIEK